MIEAQKHEQAMVEKHKQVAVIIKARDEAATSEKRSLPELENFKRQAEALESRLNAYK